MAYRFDRRANNPSGSRSKPGRGRRGSFKPAAHSEMEGPLTKRSPQSKDRRDNSESFNQSKEHTNNLSNSQGNSPSSYKRSSRRTSDSSVTRQNKYRDRKLYSQNNRENYTLDPINNSRNRSRPIDSNSSFRNSNRSYSSPSSQNLNEETILNDLLWGRHSTQAALESGRPIHRIWCTPELRSSSKFFQLIKESKGSGVLVEEVTWARLGQITGGAVHQGIALQTAASESLDLNKLIEACSSLDESALLLALDGLTDPHNLGAIIRSAEALGAHGLILPQRRSAGLTGSVAKVAAGALEHLPISRVVNLNRSLEQLKLSGYRVIGLAEEGDITLPETDLSGPLVVVTGSENKGISVLTRKHCDHLVRIPLRGEITSLNASVATALVLYEVARCNWMKGLSGQAPSPRMIRAKPFQDQ